MKLTLQHLAGYLPYGLKLWHNQWKEILTMDCTGSKSYSLSIEDVAEYTKPILHPLSDLTKEIEVNGEKFVPIDVLNKTFRPSSKDLAPYGYNGKLELDIETENYSQTIDLMDGFQIAQKLYEWHFDIHNLIENNLAIDKNTIL